jgi:hypothetical protein
MSIESDVQTAFGALVSGRCYPLTAPDPVVKPYIVFSTISDVQLNSLDGYSGIAEKRIQVDVYTTGYGVAKTLALSVKTAMATTLPASIHLSSQELFENDTQLYRVTMDFSIWSQ